MNVKKELEEILNDPMFDYINEESVKKFSEVVRDVFPTAKRHLDVIDLLPFFKEFPGEANEENAVVIEALIVKGPGDLRVGGHRDDRIGDALDEGNIIDALMGGPVQADQSSAVDEHGHVGVQPGAVMA